MVGCNIGLLPAAAAAGACICGGKSHRRRKIHVAKLGGRQRGSDAVPAVTSGTAGAASSRPALAPTPPSGPSGATTLRRLVCRVRSGLRRQTAAWRNGCGCGSGSRRRPRFEYDAKSYSLNFDDGGGRDDWIYDETATMGNATPPHFADPLVSMPLNH